MKRISNWLVPLAVAVTAQICAAQSAYQVISVRNGGTIKGTVKWEGPLPHLATWEINKDPQICDPSGQKRRDLERLIVSPSGGVANTVVFLKDITAGKPMDLPHDRQFLNQKTCRYEPHILLVPIEADLTVQNSDPLLHTVYMWGNAEYNLPFTSQGQRISRPMPRAGVVNMRCNAGHVWMNGEIMVASNPYYAVTDDEGHFVLTEVPPGQYEMVAWHEGWKVVNESPVYDLATQERMKRPVFSDPIVWSKSVTVSPGETSDVHFTLGEKSQQASGRD